MWSGVLSMFVPLRITLHVRSVTSTKTYKFHGMTVTR